MTSPTCNDEIDFHEDGTMFTCDREPDHEGRHAFTGASAILTWSNR